jgi:hypothetical protein
LPGRRERRDRQGQAKRQRAPLALRPALLPFQRGKPQRNRLSSAQTL